MMIILFILFLIIGYLIFKWLKKRHIVFIGPRNCGKTVAINSIIGQKYETLPTIKEYTLNYKNILISEKHFKNENNSINDDFNKNEMKFKNQQNINIENNTFKSYKPRFGEEIVFMARESDLKEIRKFYTGLVYILGKNNGSDGVIYIENICDFKKILNID
ncbi:hypothetical protein DMUE_1518 [Dictyocoela muelleri]|nr:hypothetical protein DMUE_1518 [Dictyocoela muelleri]